MILYFDIKLSCLNKSFTLFKLLIKLNLLVLNSIVENNSKKLKLFYSINNKFDYHLSIYFINSLGNEIEYNFYNYSS